MKYITPLEDFHPKLQAILKEFARKSHAVNLEVVRPDFIIDQSQIKPEYKTAIFIDPRFPKRIERRERVGYVKVSEGDLMEIGSRLIKNDKYRRHSLEYNTKASKIESKVVKMMVDFLKPFSFGEIFEFHDDKTASLVKSWRNELYKAGESIEWSRENGAHHEKCAPLEAVPTEAELKEMNALADRLLFLPQKKDRSNARRRP